MKIFLQSILALILALGSVSVQAMILKCTSQDPSNKLIVLYNSDPKNHTLDVNGETHKIVAPTKDRSGVATDNFTMGNDVIVYDSFIKNDTGDFTLHRFNAMTDETIYKVKVKCEEQK